MAFLFRDRLRVLVGSAIAILAVHRANAMAELRDLDGRPMKLRHRRDQPRDYARLAEVARVPADDYRCHSYFFFASLAKVASSFRYSRMGLAGVPQKTTPLPRITLLLGTPDCAPRITPSSMCT